MSTSKDLQRHLRKGLAVYGMQKGLDTHQLHMGDSGPPVKDT